MVLGRERFGAVKFLHSRELRKLPLRFRSAHHIESGQIIATSHDLGPQKVAVWKGNLLISRKSRLVIYFIIWPDRNIPFLFGTFVHLQAMASTEFRAVTQGSSDDGNREMLQDGHW